MFSYHNAIKQKINNKKDNEKFPVGLKIEQDTYKLWSKQEVMVKFT